MQDNGALRIARTSTAGASAHWRSNASNRLPCATQRKPRSANQRRKASRSTAARSGQAPQSIATLLRQVLGAAQNIKTGGKLDLFLPHQRALPPGGRGVARRLKRMTMGPTRTRANKTNRKRQEEPAEPPRSPKRRKRKRRVGCGGWAGAPCRGTLRPLRSSSGPSGCPRRRGSPCRWCPCRGFWPACLPPRPA